MDKNRVKGAVKEAAGRLTGNNRLKIEGAAEKVEGKILAQVGKAKDAIRHALR
jgi:uncharacterized protein YjbJ (UPF0337 family)